MKNEMKNGEYSCIYPIEINSILAALFQLAQITRNWIHIFLAGKALYHIISFPLAFIDKYKTNYLPGGQEYWKYVGLRVDGFFV